MNWHTGQRCGAVKWNIKVEIEQFNLLQRFYCGHRVIALDHEPQGFEFNDTAISDSCISLLTFSVKSVTLDQPNPINWLGLENELFQWVTVLNAMKNDDVYDMDSSAKPSKFEMNFAKIFSRKSQTEIFFLHFSFINLLLILQSLLNLFHYATMATQFSN